MLQAMLQRAKRPPIPILILLQILQQSLSRAMPRISAHILLRTASARASSSGLQYKVLTASGSQEHPVATDCIKVHYAGRLIDGREFDSSYGRGAPAQFPLNRVIPGWTEALQYMGIGDKFELTIPAYLAYGNESRGDLITPGATLIFDVELLDNFGAVPAAECQNYTPPAE
jgi:hypothetical protein